MLENKEEIFLGKLTEEEESFWNKVIKNFERNMPYREFEKFVFNPGSPVSRNSVLASGGTLSVAMEEICMKLRIRQGEGALEDKDKTLVIHFGMETLTII